MYPKKGNLSGYGMDKRTLRLRRGKAKKGDVIVFQCGRNIEERLSRDRKAV
jgi:hypothetical protein